MYLRILIFVLFLPLTACMVVVKDFGAYWDQGTVDSLLAGRWHEVDSGNKDSITITLQGSQYLLTESEHPENPLIARVLLLKGHTFLMIRGHANEQPEQTLVLYKIVGNSLITYRPNPAKRAEFERHYFLPELHIEKNSGQTDEECTLRIIKLTPRVISLITHLASQPSYWLESSRLERF